MDLREIAIVWSLSLTVPTVFGCVGVLWLWHASALKSWRLSHKEEVHWFVLGVVLGFFGSFVDNLYWAAAWAADYYNSGYAGELFSAGVYPNIFFRQICGALAAACHIRAAVASTSWMFRTWVIGGWIAGAALGVALVTSGD